VAIMQALPAIKKAVLAFHRWFMKYSGMTMIIDNVEERRRWRHSKDRSEEDSGSSCGRDPPSQKQEMETFTRPAAHEDSNASSTSLGLGLNEENKEVLG
jgi:hypothetical protein